MKVRWEIVYIVVGLLGFMFGYEAQGCTQVDAIRLQIERHSTQNSNVDVHQLALAIDKYSRQFELSPYLLVAIFRVESEFKIDAYNSRTRDYGLAQINEYNVKHMGLNKKRLMADLFYSVKTGAIVLSWFKERYAFREPRTWACRYNIGVRNTKALRRQCRRYLRKLERYM